MGNSTTGCPVHYMPEDPEPFIKDGDINFKLHQVGWIVAGFFGLIGSAASFWLIVKHLQFYTKPSQQKYIIRILFMVPCYAIYSWFSYYWWKEALYFQLIRDCYEAVVIASFFSLLLYYLGDTPQEHAIVFKNVKFKKWIWPMGRWRYKPSGPRFLSIMQWSIGQYWICRPGCTFAAVITQAFNLYCLDSWSPRFSHVWTSAVICISVTIAMYAVLQFYVTMKVELAPYNPMMKFFAVKAVVFFTFWGECMLILLATLGVIKGNTYWSAHEIQVGISAVLSCFVMMVFGFLHIKSFSYLPYRGNSLDPKERKFSQTKVLPALGNVLDFRDVFRDVWTGTKQIGRLCTGKKVEHSFIQDTDHLENVFGRSRIVRKDDATRALMREKTDIEQELERIKFKTSGDPDSAFISGLPMDAALPSKRTETSAASTPWANTTTAFTPLLNFSRTLSPFPSSAQGAIPTAATGSQTVGATDNRRMPKSSTGLLYPATPFEVPDDGQNVTNPEKIVGDGDEMVYEKPKSWFRRVFRRSAGVGVGVHSSLPQAPNTSRDDAIVEEILEDRSLSYDYPSATIEQLRRKQESPPQRYPTPKPYRSHKPSPRRNGVLMPNPLSPSRYPGFNEQAYVDRMYALHAAALNVVSPPTLPLTQASRTRPQYIYDEHNTYTTPQRISAPFIQPPNTISQPMNGLGSSAVRLPRHDLPAARLDSPAGDSRRDTPRRPLPTPPGHSASQVSAFSPMPLSANSQVGTPQQPSMQVSSYLEESHRSRRHGPVQRLGLGLSLDTTGDRVDEPSTCARPTSKFIYEEY